MEIGAKKIFIMANLGHVLKESFVGKLPSSKTMELSENTPEHKAWAKYRRQNATVGAAIVEAEENEDVILGLQESNELTITWPSGVAPNMWKELKNMFQPDDFLKCQ